MSSYPIKPTLFIPTSSSTKLAVKDFLPKFSAEQEPAVYIENTRFDAKQFCYDEPLVRLGQAGYLVDYGYKLGYFMSTWQGQVNPSLRFQDLQLLLFLAQKRTRNEADFSHFQSGYWGRPWRVGGEDLSLKQQLEKLEAAGNIS